MNTNPNAQNPAAPVQTTQNTSDALKTPGMADSAALDASNAEIHTFTTADLELLVKIAAREQRYKCAEYHDAHWRDIEDHGGERLQNTLCPDVADVLMKWREMLKDGK